MHPTTLLLLATITAVSTATAARVYYTDQPAGSAGSIMAVDLDGTDPATVITYPVTPAPPDLRGIAWHRASGRIFFLDNGAATKRIRSIFPTGSGQLDVVNTDPTLLGSDVEIDDAAGKLYWTEHNSGSTGNGFVRRANLDGTNPETVVTTTPGISNSPYFLFVDAAAGFLYWGVQEGPSGSAPTSFRRNTLAGAVDPTFVTITTSTRTRDIQIDPATATAYWNDRQTGTIFSRPLSGGDNQTVLSGLNAPHGIALDLQARKIYMADTGQRNGGPQWPQSSARRVIRCNFDGSEYETLTAGTSTAEPWDLALDLSCPTYNDWRSRFFRIINPLGLATQDPDGDGLNNLLEYAFDGQPRLSSLAPLPVAMSNGIKFSRRRVSPLTYQVEVSTNLTTWNFNGDGSGQTWTSENAVTPVDDEMDSVEVIPGPALIGATKVYFRVRVTLP